MKTLHLFIHKDIKMDLEGQGERWAISIVSSCKTLNSLQEVNEYHIKIKKSEVMVCNDFTKTTSYSVTWVHSSLYKNNTCAVPY